MRNFYVPVIDADRLIYAAGFLSETKNEDGTTEVGPLNHALQIIKTTLGGILNVFDVAHNDEGYWLYLSGKGNFRYDVAKIKPYKGNRKTPKPFWYNEMRQYLVEQHGAILSEGMEADDVVTMKALEDDRYVIVDVDKDYLQVPGVQYNPVKEEWLTISEHDAILNYWTQVLVGDTVDNITGCPKIGKKKAPQILHGARTERTMYERCKEAYRKAYHSGCRTHDGKIINADEALHENMALLHLLRYEGDSWENRIL